MRAFDLLHRELDAWSDDEALAAFWWRDDDLCIPTDKLDPLLRTAAALEAEPLLAVVPKWATDDLPRLLSGESARVAVHGWAHVNHETAQAKKAEFGPARPVASLVADAVAGRDKLAALFGDQLTACFVPPWNRVAPELIPALSGVGFSALSTYGTAGSDTRDLGLSWINTHVDVIDWRGDRRFIGSNAMARCIVNQLSHRRQETTSTVEPLGLLTHHLEMTSEDWFRFKEICQMLMTHPAVRMLGSRDLFERRRDA
jgi:hypothetical protein